VDPNLLWTAERCSALLAHLWDGVALTSCNGLVMYANPAFERMFGYREGELTGCSISLVHSPYEFAGLGERIRTEALAGGWSGEFLGIRKDGSELMVALRATPFRGGDGRSQGIVGVYRDVTAQTHVEQERIRSAQFEGVLQTVRRVNHEVNNPLHALMGAVELLQMCTPEASSEVSAAIAVIRDSCQQLAALTKSLARVVRMATTETPVGLMLDLEGATKQAPPDSDKLG